MHNAFCTYYIADIPQGRLKTEIEKLAQHPKYAYLKQLQTAKNTDWHQVRLAYDKWDYKHEGLTGAGAALIALAVAAATAGSGTGAALGLKGTAAASADAAFASLATQASISLINNKGNIGNTLKELGRSSTVKNLVVAAATAGVSDKIGASSALKVSNTQWINKLTVNLANAGSAALIDGAVNGGSLKDKLEANILSALVDTAHGEVAGKIKQLDRHYIAHKIAHAVAGCAAATANKGKCRDGAIGAAVGEIIGEALLDGRNPATLSAQDKAKIAARSKLVAGTVAALNNGDVNAAANAAEVAVRNNALSNPEIIAIGKRVDKECNKGNYAECKNKIIAESVKTSDQRSKLTKQDVADITAVQNKYAVEAFSICKGNSACATFVGNKFTYARLHCASSGCMSNIAQTIIRETSSRYGSVWDTASRVFEDFSPILPTTKAVPFNFGSKQLLLDHFKKHGSEFGVKTANEYLQIGRDVMQKGSRVKYKYKGENRIGFVQFFGNSKNGEAKFVFVGTNNQGVITTIHVEKGKNFWKTLNGNPTKKEINQR